MRKRMMACVVPSLFLFSCRRTPEQYPVPVQRVEESGPATVDATQFVSMGAPWAEEFIVKDILRGPGSGHYRWTGANPALKLRAAGAGPWKLVVNFTVAEATFRSTGPVRVEFAANGVTAGSILCKSHGAYRFEKNVDIETGEVIISGAIDRTWVSPDDGVRLGVMLMDVGLFAR